MNLLDGITSSGSNSGNGDCSSSGTALLNGELAFGSPSFISRPRSPSNFRSFSSFSKALSLSSVGGRPQLEHKLLAFS
jgi:hypothetical protein